MSPESPHEASQYHIFNHCLARILLSRLDVVNNSQDPNTSQDHTGQESDLDDFSSYLSSESWPSLPPSLQTATYESRDAVPDPDVLPLGSIPPSFFDTMAAYGITSDTDESMSFIRHVLRDFVQEACAPPPVWSSTRTTECEICEREVPLTYHHLIPRSTHEKARKRKWHPESMLDSVAWLCRFVSLQQTLFVLKRRVWLSGLVIPLCIMSLVTMTLRRIIIPLIFYFSGRTYGDGGTMLQEKDLE